ncbi:MAG: DUF4013 domain-containing protein [Arenicella sp.]|nr:DUF4013 domain-containing protein [Arenicella sp.]
MNSGHLAKCKFHPLDSAMNHCELCDADYCELCSGESAALAVTRTRADKVDHKCFVCAGPMMPLQGSQRIAPFWSRLPDIYRYPFNLDAVSALLIVSLITAFIGNSGLLLIIPSVAMMLYSFACLRETAKGNLKAPGFEACFEGSIAPVFYALIVILVFGVGAFMSFGLGLGFGILALTFCILALPAAIILIATDEKLLPALNILALASVMKAAGISYFVMLLFIIIMISSVFALMSLFGGQANSFFGILFESLISNYYSVVVYHIMGYLVYQNQEALGFKTIAGGAETSVRSDSDRRKAHIEALIKAGDYDKAQEVAGKQLLEPDSTLWDWSRAFTLTCVATPSRNAEQVFNDYASKLEAAGETDKLADAYLQLKKHQPKFVIKDHQQRLSIADSLFETGQYSQVVNMLHLFYQESNDNKHIIRALKLLSESLLSIPKREKLAKQYAALYQLQLNKAE